MPLLKPVGSCELRQMAMSAALRSPSANPARVRSPVDGSRQIHLPSSCFARRQSRRRNPEAAGNLTTDLYDGFNRLAKIQFPSTTRGAGTSDPANAEAAYDTNGNRLTLTKRDGTTVIGFADDVLNRPTAKTFAFDSAGQFANVADVANDVKVALGYDSLGRSTSLSRRPAAVSTTTISAGGYDAADRMLNLTHAFAPTTANVAYTFGYTPASQVASAATTNPAYDCAGASAQTINTSSGGLNRDAAIAAVGARRAA